eukprot:TRINITY_DN17760_c0_g1_i2.p1 TRINITY_DN17760_c0_g1~~TRINITY_DN17760_c0_g1_i2.p1  ORF type:complete len:290 (+),score=68.32 TRINITY_DN17760_c0_g1_i2:198-1067(+)
MPLPPETLDTEWWYPLGDIWSLGITFFQIMIGQIPSDEIDGILQLDGDDDYIAEMTRNVRIPWASFPDNMPLLLDLVTYMLQPDRHERASATRALQHEWFETERDAPLPAATLRGLLGASSVSVARAEAVQQLSASNNLDELRVLQSSMSTTRALASRGNAAAGAALLQEHGVTPQTAGKLGGAASFSKLVEEAILFKESFCSRFILDLFHDLDTDESGALSRDELEGLLQSDAFECPDEDVEGLIERMTPDSKGVIQLEEFQRVMMDDGRIARRTTRLQDEACMCVVS